MRYWHPISLGGAIRIDYWSNTEYYCKRLAFRDEVTWPAEMLIPMWF